MQVGSGALTSSSMLFGFSAQLDEKIHQSIESALLSSPGPHYAAFDADGTLWDTDVGERFFRHQIQHSDLPNLPPDPWQHYYDLKEVDYKAACLWLAQINAGQSEDQVRRWAHAAASDPLPVFPPVQRLIAFLLERNVQVKIVTASVQWAVEPAVHHVGVHPQHVIGIRTKISDGIITAEPEHPVTWREGKREALLHSTAGIPPLLCAGNSTGDLHLLETATHVALAIRSENNQHGELCATELRLQEEAQRRGWFRHTFSSN